MIEVGNIVTLDNGQEFLLLEEMEKETNKYVYAVRVEKDDSPTDEYTIFGITVDSEGEFLKPIQDKMLYDQLIEDFREIVTDKIINGEYEDLENIEEEAA